MNSIDRPRSILKNNVVKVQSVTKVDQSTITFETKHLPALVAWILLYYREKFLFNKSIYPVHQSWLNAYLVSKGWHYKNTKRCKMTQSRNVMMILRFQFFMTNFWNCVFYYPFVHFQLKHTCNIPTVKYCAPYFFVHKNKIKSPKYSNWFLAIIQGVK